MLPNMTSSPAIPWLPPTAIGSQTELPTLLIAGSSLDSFTNSWLRTMAEDKEVVTLINEHFQPVFVDTLKHEGLALTMQNVLGLTAEAQGWPLSAFATPSGSFFGASPWRNMRADAENSHGFLNLLIDVAQTWQEQGENITADAEQFKGVLAQLEELPPAEKSFNKTLAQDACEAHAMEAADSLEGGFGESPRYFNAPLLHFLLKRTASGKTSASVRAHVERTITAYIAGGMHDHLGGGFFHGCSDPVWGLPFFEKTTADQAIMSSLLLAAASALENPLAHTIASTTLLWTIHTLQTDDGAFMTGLDAESFGAGEQLINGAYYAWSKEAIADVLGQELGEHFLQRYWHDERAALDATFHIPAIQGALDDADANARLPEACRRLLIARHERPSPARNEDCRASDQGLILETLAQFLNHPLTTETDHEDILPAAKKCAAQLPPLEELNTYEKAVCGRGAQAWFTFSTDESFLNYANNALHQLEEHFAKHGGFTISSAHPSHTSAADMVDTPWRESTAACTAQLAQQLGNTDFQNKIIEAHAALTRYAPLACAGLLRSLL